MQAKLGDAAVTMMMHRAKKEQFDLVDLDPFGSAAPFLDSGAAPRCGWKQGGGAAWGRGWMGWLDGPPNAAGRAGG